VEKPSPAYFTGLHHLPRFLSDPLNGKGYWNHKVPGADNFPKFL